MGNIAETKLLEKLVDRWGDVGIKSTGAALVNYSGVLYNVDGSSTDPQIDGSSWKRLLMNYGIDSQCYVNNPTPNGNSHPGFNVGGHMTSNPDGSVETGTDSYLMPLCSWHNSKGRDGVAFTHANTLMLKLSGYMHSELTASFMARLPSEERFAIIYASGNEWKNANLTDNQASDAKSGELSEDVLMLKSGQFVLLERVGHDDDLRYIVAKSQLKQ